MKRSEMIEKLANRFLIQDILAEEIIDFVIESGMNPPERVRYTDLQNGRTVCSPEFTWESEYE